MAFVRARAVWLPACKNRYNQFALFHTRIDGRHLGRLQIAVAARSFYRLYINGEMIAHGPARAAQGHCRIDRLEITAPEPLDVAVEAAAYDKPEKYCNDCTLEPGLLAVEISDLQGNILTGTGDDAWRGVEQFSRRSAVETMSHSRGILEWYDLYESDAARRLGRGDGWVKPCILPKEPVWLERRAPYPDYAHIPAKRLLHVRDLQALPDGAPVPLLDLAEKINPRWYAMIPEESCLIRTLAARKPVPFSGHRHETTDAQGDCQIEICPGGKPASLTWEYEHSDVGFIDISVSTPAACTLDIINSDCLNARGEVDANTFALHYSLAPGQYHLTGFEPKHIRYIRVDLQASQPVKLSAPRIVRYTAPDDDAAFFKCSDGDLNRICDAARRTLRLNTLDIFMDCPQRERGGWLCDSYFTAQGAWQIPGGLSVERDFLENFMLTDPNTLKSGLFPEVYPGVHKSPEDVGIENWSFWLLLELAEYRDRSGDTGFIEACRARVCRCVEGMLAMRGSSGLIEGLKAPFVDWSISNAPCATQPISIPVNALAASALERMADLYAVPSWAAAAKEMRQIITSMDSSDAESRVRSGDAATYEGGRLARAKIRTESGIATELFCGFHRNDRALIHDFLRRMGPACDEPADLNPGRSNLFIGLMVRFAVLEQMGKAEQLLREWKAVYLPQLYTGADTLFETIGDEGGCHGFNAAVPAMMTRLVLGLKDICPGKRLLTLSPHVCRLKWASGMMQTPDGPISLGWAADEDAHTLDITLDLPRGWQYRWRRPFELTGWEVSVNGLPAGESRKEA